MKTLRRISGPATVQGRDGAESSQIAAPSPQSRARAWLQNFVLLLGTSLLCLGAIEIFVRYSLAPAPVGPSWSDRPAFYYKAADTPSFSNLRHEPSKAPGTFRIAVVGDSFTFPTYMQFDDAFPARLERILRLNGGETANHVEVLNYGKKGLSTRSEVKVVQHALQGNPDLVVLQITLNDPQKRAFHTLKDLNLPNYTFGELVITPESHPILYYWKTLGWIAKRVHNSRTRESLIRYHQDLFKDPETWDPFSNAIRAIKAECDERGVKLVTLVFPMFFSRIDDSYPFAAAHAKIGSLLSELGVPSLDLLSTFRNIPPERLHVMPGVDSHPNELAHARAAEALYTFLQAQKLLPEAVQLHERYHDRSEHPVVHNRSGGAHHSKEKDGD